MTKNNDALKALIVEDEKYISKLYSFVLSEEGFDIDIAEHGKEATQRLLDTNYSIVVCDIKMPQMNGEELFNWMLNERPEQIKGWIFATGSVMGGKHRKFLESSGRPVLLKPFSSDELIKTVEKIIKENNHER